MVLWGHIGRASNSILAEFREDLPEDVATQPRLKCQWQLANTWHMWGISRRGEQHVQRF